MKSGLNADRNIDRDTGGSGPNRESLTRGPRSVPGGRVHRALQKRSPGAYRVWHGIISSPEEGCSRSFRMVNSLGSTKVSYNGL